MEDVRASGNSYGSWILRKDSLETRSVRDYHAKVDNPMNFQYSSIKIYVLPRIEKRNSKTHDI